MLKNEICKITKYEFQTNDFRTKIIANDTIYILYITMGGNGFDMVELHKGEVWCEGADDVIGLYTTKEEASIVLKEYIDRK